MALPEVYVQLPLFPTSKVCCACVQSKPLEHFHKDRHTADGRQSMCRTCRVAYNRQWRHSHPDQARRLAHAHYARNRDRILERQRQARDAAPEENRTRCRASYQRHKAEAFARVKAWCNENPQTALSYRTTYRQAHPVAYLAYARIRRARKRQAEGRHSEADILALFDAQVGICYYCCATLEHGYHVDHKQPASRGGSEWPANLALTCAKCNLRKHNKTEAEFRAILARDAVSTPRWPS